MDKFFLGDGLYVQVDSVGQIVFSAPRGRDEHYVALEPEVLASFGLWLRATQPGLADHLSEAMKQS